MVDLIKWRPFHSLMQGFFRDTEPLFGNSRLLSRGNLWYEPRMDIRDLENEVQVILDTPGMDKKDIDITVEDDVLVVKGERTQENRKEENGYVHYEREFGAFERRVRLPENVEQDQLKAEYKEGVLTVTAPKAKVEKPEAKKVKIA